MASKAKDAKNTKAATSIGLFQCRQTAAGSEIEPFDVAGPLFSDQPIAEALADRGEEGAFEGIILRGLADE